MDYVLARLRTPIGVKSKAKKCVAVGSGIEINEQQRKGGITMVGYRMISLYLSIDSRITGWLRTNNGRCLLIGLSLGYTTMGAWSVWESWYTRSVAGVIVGMMVTLTGASFATLLSFSLYLDKNIDVYASRVLREQASRDKDRDAMYLDGVSGG